MEILGAFLVCGLISVLAQLLVECIRGIHGPTLFLLIQAIGALLVPLGAIAALRAPSLRAPADSLARRRLRARCSRLPQSMCDPPQRACMRRRLPLSPSPAGGAALQSERFASSSFCRTSCVLQTYVLI